MFDPAVSHLLALCGTLLFGAAAFAKVRSFAMFCAILGEYRILPIRITTAAGAAICCLEFAVAVGLFWPGSRSPAATLGAVLLIAYAAAITVNLIRGRRDLDCGCGYRPTAISGWMVIRNVVLAALLTLLQMPLSPRVLGLADYATIAGGLTGFALLFLSAEALLARPAAREFSASP
jgi:hypothetical protein